MQEIAAARRMHPMLIYSTNGRCARHRYTQRTEKTPQHNTAEKDNINAEKIHKLLPPAQAAAVFRPARGASCITHRNSLSHNHSKNADRLHPESAVQLHNHRGYFPARALYRTHAAQLLYAVLRSRDGRSNAAAHAPRYVRPSREPLVLILRRSRDR